eukprot:EG_transcript_28223
MPFGDSLTQGGHTFAYRRRLWHLLNASGYAVRFVGSQTRVMTAVRPKPAFGAVEADFDIAHESWAGRRTLDCVRLVPVPRLMRRTMPDIVLLLLGTNDAVAGDPPPRTVTRLRQIVTAMHAVNPSVTVLLSTLPTIFAREGAFRRVKEVNGLLPALAASLNRLLVKRRACPESDPCVAGLAAVAAGPGAGGSCRPAANA